MNQILIEEEDRELQIDNSSENIKISISNGDDNVMIGITEDEARTFIWGINNCLSDEKITSHQSEIRLIENFLHKNYWGSSLEDGVIVFSKGSNFDIEVGKDEIVFISDRGDFLHLPLNIYALVGAMLEYRILKTNFSIQQAREKTTINKFESLTDSGGN